MLAYHFFVGIELPTMEFVLSNILNLPSADDSGNAGDLFENDLSKLLVDPIRESLHTTTV